MDTTFLRRCLTSLERAMEEIQRLRCDDDNVIYDIYRAACVKEFELVLEQSGKLLRKRLAAFFASNQQADRLTFKDLFRYAAKHALIDTDTVERWLDYRDNRNATAHDYGRDFAETTLKLLPIFIVDAKALADMIEAAEDE
ncbi:MAG: nucleotidyltransferase substrate binding protein [Aestuariivita sp.]|nr:nucleotidyltransferase substrate binding protein [Aestuariivita sp.]